MTNGTELQFGGEIREESRFRDIPDGEYTFRVERIERARHNGSEKVPPCSKMVVHLSVLLDDGSEGHLSEQFLLWSSMEWKLSAFFICIGMKKKGEAMEACNCMTEIPGRTGRCRIKQTPGRTDSSRTYAHIEAFLEPQTTDWTAGF